MHASFQQVWQKILDVDKINIYTHRGPDGDSLGSCVGLKRMIGNVKPHSVVKVIGLDALAGKLATCDIAGDVQTFDDSADLYIYPDTPTSTMVVAQHSPSICIDHHATRSYDADLTFSRNWPSCCGLLYREFLKVGQDVSVNVADALIIGAVTDTGFGQFGNVQNRKDALNDMMDLDAICGRYSSSYVKNFTGLTMKQEDVFSQIIPHIKISGGVLTLRVPDSIATSLNLSDIRMILQEITTRIPANYYVWGYKSREMSRYSVRGDGKDLSFFAKKYGGGGHAGAASFESNVEPRIIFDDFRLYLKK